MQISTQQEQDVGAAYESTCACRHLHWLEYVGLDSADLLASIEWPTTCLQGSVLKVPAVPTSSSAPDRPWQKALQRSWPCLGRHNLPGHSYSCCSPPPASRAGTLCAECGSQLLSRSQILSPFRQHHVMEYFFPLLAHACAVMCAFLDFANLNSEQATPY